MLNLAALCPVSLYLCLIFLALPLKWLNWSIILIVPFNFNGDSSLKNRNKLESHLRPPESWPWLAFTTCPSHASCLLRKQVIGTYLILFPHHSFASYQSICWVVLIHQGPAIIFMLSLMPKEPCSCIPIICMRLYLIIGYMFYSFWDTVSHSSTCDKTCEWGVKVALTVY